MSVNKQEIWNELKMDNLLNDKLSNKDEWKVYRNSDNVIFRSFKDDRRGIECQIGNDTKIVILLNFISIDITLKKRSHIKIGSHVYPIPRMEELASKTIWFDMKLQKEIRNLFAYVKYQKNKKEKSDHLNKIPKSIKRDNSLDELLNDD